MQVELTPEQESFVQQAVETGRIQGPEDAVREALSLWADRERARVELRLAFGQAEADLREGRYEEYTNETLADLAKSLKSEMRSLPDKTRD